MAKKRGKKKSRARKSPARKKRRTPKKKKVAAKRSKARTVKKRPKVKKRKRSIPELPAEPIGRVTHYFSKARAAAVRIERDGIRVGDTLYFKGHTTHFKQPVQSLQIDCQPVSEAQPEQEVGIGVRSKVREHDQVFKL